MWYLVPSADCSRAGPATSQGTEISSTSQSSARGDGQDHLAEVELLEVAAVVAAAGGRLRLVERQEHGVRQVSRPAVRFEAEAGVGQQQPAATVEQAPHDRPLTGDDLVRPVDVGVAEQRAVGVVLEHRVLGADHGRRERHLVRRGHDRIGLPDRDRHPRRREELGLEQPAVDGHAADRQEAPGPAGQGGGHVAEPPVGGHVTSKVRSPSAASIVSGKCGSPWMWVTSGGISGTSWVPRWKIVTW